LLSSEQASNDAIAKFHASLISPSTSLLDLTAGLGIDDMSFAFNDVDVTACEIDTIKCETLHHNSAVMGISNKLTIFNVDSIDFIRECNKKYDVVYADPARRNDSGARVHALSDCQPDILSALHDILRVAPRLLIKSSPLLDLTLIRNTVTELNQIYVVCFKGECKEVLIDIQKDSSFEGVTVVDIDRYGELSRFHSKFLTTNLDSKAPVCNRKNASDYTYLYEPNAGVMKTGAWSELTGKFPELSKADTNTQIFLSDVLYSNFPGRVMQIYSEPDKKALKALKGAKINIVSRNHPLLAPQIATKFSLKPGSERFLYAFRYRETPTILLATTVK
nr:class I SAM-dependent methyltransferase [Muribaculaceae bacterium]